MSTTNERLLPGRFGRFGGRYVAESLWTPLQEIADAFDEAVDDPKFVTTMERWLDHRIGRPTPVSHLGALSERVGGAQIWVKREDLCQGGSFSINTAVLQVLLARRLGRRSVIGETGTGDFGVALGSIAAAMGLEARIFMGREDLENETLNVQRMLELGVVIETVDTGTRGRKRACSEALRFWATHSNQAHYCASSLAMPDPFPRILAYALGVIGAETRVQLKRRGCDPEYIIAPIGSGAFGVGLFSEFAKHTDIQLVGVQGGGDGHGARTSASLVVGSPGVFMGTHSYLLQDDNGQVLVPHSIAGGLCVPNVGPQHARWAAEGRVHYVAVSDDDACLAVRTLARTEGLLVCLESGHALSYAIKIAATLGSEQHVVVGITGSGLRDLERLDQFAHSRQTP
ncbi:MAG: pyridoxal-phosphate dependent enzyme [Bradymonadaceae bacterium]|nr:pyridoxal-phosphate dependent enzyme [Lujinxingiaceae bacterium]